MPVELSPAGLAAVASAAFAVLSFALNFVVVRRQARMQLEDLRIKVDSDVLGWGREAIDALADAQRLLASRPHVTEPAFEQDRLTAMQRLSSLADQGRLYFPNFVTDDFGRHKEAAFKGYRQPIIDALVFGYSLLEHWETASRRPASAIEFLWRCRRLVVSELQIAIDPRRRKKAIATMSKAKKAEDIPSYQEAIGLGDTLNALAPDAFDRAVDGRVTIPN